MTWQLLLFGNSNGKNDKKKEKTKPETQSVQMNWNQVLFCFDAKEKKRLRLPGFGFL